MLRLRLASVAVAACLGLVCGCTCCWQFPLLERFRARVATDCCEGGGVLPGSEGPLVEGPPINGGVPGGPGIVPVPMSPQNTLPPLASPPRIAPQPQAQPTPYTPQ